jgi:hypothetical protein
MTLDQLQYVFLLGIFPVAVWTITDALPVNGSAKLRIVLLLVLWFVLTWATEIPNLGRIPGALFGIIFPVVGVSLYMVLSANARKVISGLSVAPLVALHITRVTGGLFIPLHWEGRLSNPFAYVAGGGDVLAACLAIPAAVIAYRGKPGWEKWVLMWNVIGFADFVSAVTLGATSQPGSFLQVFSNSFGTSILGALPWRFIPSFFVPLYLMIHVALFIRLLPYRSFTSSKSIPTPEPGV